MNEQIAEAFVPLVVKMARSYLSDEHFTVDGTLIEAWASHKSFRPKEEEPGKGAGNEEANFDGESQSNDTHQSATDAEARLYKRSKGSEAKPSYLGNGLMENRSGLLVKTVVTPAHGTAERDAPRAWRRRLRGPSISHEDPEVKLIGALDILSKTGYVSRQHNVLKALACRLRRRPIQDVQSERAVLSLLAASLDADGSGHFRRESSSQIGCFAAELQFRPTARMSDCR